MTIRALAAGLLAGPGTRIASPSDCDDARAARRVAGGLGGRFEPWADGLELVERASPSGTDLDCGESGLTFRSFAAIAALEERELTLVASGSLTRRPINMLEAPLSALGVRCESRAGRPPLRVCGPLRPGRARVEAVESSQHLTGLLMALPLAAGQGATELEVDGLASEPYVWMTLELLEAFGVELDRAPDLTAFCIPAGQRYRPGQTFRVEGDWSGAAALLVAGALAGRVSVRGLRLDSRQADRAVVEALERAGAELALEPDRVTATRGRPEAFAFDASACPDLLPPLCALACGCPGESRLGGAGRLRHKESDRAAALMSELGKLGAHIRLDGDHLVVRGGTLGEAEVDPHGDHRIAMACAAAAVGAGGTARIRDPGCVAKSYPAFFRDLTALGAEVR